MGKTTCFPSSLACREALAIAIPLLGIGIASRTTRLWLNRCGSSRFGFAPPSITPKTLRLYPAQNGSSSLVLQNSLSWTVAFSGNNFCMQPPHDDMFYLCTGNGSETVTYGPTTNPGLFTCDVNRLASSAHTVVCSTEVQSTALCSTLAISCAELCEWHKSRFPSGIWRTERRRH